MKNIRPWIDYGLAVGSVAVALLLPFWFTALENVAAFLCLAAVAVCAWMGGFGPGLLATAVSAVALAYFYVPPLYSFEIGVLECVELGVFVLVAFLISSLHATQARLEASLRRQAESRHRFLAVLAHELRTPLSAIFNSLEVMRQRQSDHAGAEWAQSLLERQARHMERLIGELLDASRIERGKIMLYKQTMDLIPAVVDAVETVSALIEERGHELDVILPPEAIYVEADPTRLQQIISNLLTNAAKYTEAHGAICVVVERNAREAVLRVRDNGAGLAPEIVPLLFEPFVQAKNGSQGGLGIGLHLVKGLVRLHGGSIAATSNGIGQGSEFIVRLPRADGCRSREPESGQIAELGCPALRT